MVDAHITASIAYIRASEGATTVDTLDGIKRSQVANLVSLIGRTPIALADATRAIGVVNDSSFSASQKQELLTAIHARASMASLAAAEGDTSGQRHIFIYHYMPEALWNHQMDRSASELDRGIGMVKFMHQLGLYFPDAITIKTITSTMLHAQGSSPTHGNAKALYDLICTQNKSRRPLKKHAIMLEKVYPQDVNQFAQLHPTVYPPDGLPVACRVNAGDVAALAPTLAARNTHASVRPQGHTAPATQMPRMDPQMFMAMGQAFAAMHGGSWPQAGGHTAPAAPQQPALLPPTGGGILALENGSLTTPPPNAGTGSSASGSARGEWSQHAPAAGGAAVAGGAAPPSGDAGSDGGAAPNDLDALLGIGLASGKPAKKGATPGKTKKAVLKKPAVEAKAWTTPPPFGTPCPLIYLGCKVYEQTGKYRIYPRPGESKYDKSFTFGGDKKTAWVNALNFCKAPSIPKDSPNYIPPKPKPK